MDVRLVVANLGCEVISDISLAEIVRYLSGVSIQHPIEGRGVLFVLTRSGTSLLIINCTFPHKLADFEKLTRYFRENVNETCAFISMRTPVKSSSSESSSSSDVFFLPLRDLEVLAFFTGLDDED